MRILFLCTAHNSLSQRVYLALSRRHDVTIEYALSDVQMVEAVALFKPDIVLCPFLTALVPKQIYENVLTLIVHPGPPGDAGPSALDWVLMGDDGSIEDADDLLKHLDTGDGTGTRSHWGVTVLQAIEEFDAGPIWAFEQFAIDIDAPGLTKSTLYRNEITRAAITAVYTAVVRLEDLATQYPKPEHARGPNLLRPLGRQIYSPSLKPLPAFGKLCTSQGQVFQGGYTHTRPLLKAGSRDFDVCRHTAQQISRRIRSGDSQPGVLSKVFGPSMYVYGGHIQEKICNVEPTAITGIKAGILAIHNDAVCVSTVDGKGVWISHIRQPKAKKDKALWPKVPAVSGLLELGVLSIDTVEGLRLTGLGDWQRSTDTFQEVWIDYNVDDHDNRTAYLHFDFYNGAMSTNQCSHLIEAMEYILTRSTHETLRAVVLMGGSYFSNGIALNVIEAAIDPAQESWLNINRIDDVVELLLVKFPKQNIVTIAAIRGNAAAGGVALATACDYVISGSEVIFNPAYRAVGLFGSEYHTLSYYGRCGETKAKHVLRAMTPMSAVQARQVGLVDFLFPGHGDDLDDHIRSHVGLLLKDGAIRRGQWKKNVNTSPAGIALARTKELSEMSKDFWSVRSPRYHVRRFDFVRKVKPTSTPLRFAIHRRRPNTKRDEEETAAFDDLAFYQRRTEQDTLLRLRAEVWSEVTSMMEQWEQDHKGEKRLRVAMPPKHELTPPASSLVSPLEPRGETLFSCYYKPMESLLTPPESPMPGYWQCFNKGEDYLR